MKLWKAGKTFYDNQWVKRSKLKGVVEFLDVSESVSFDDIQSMTGKKNTKHGRPSEPAEDEPPAKCGKKGGEPEATETKGGTGGTEKQGKEQGGTVPEKPEKKRKGKGEENTELKEISMKVTKTMTLRKELATACQACNDLLSQIAGESSWAWARSDATLQPLRAAREKIEEFKTSHEFWKQWVLNDRFTEYCKTHYSVSETRIQLEKQYKLDKLLKKLSAEVTNLKRMQASRVKAESDTE